MRGFLFPQKKIKVKVIEEQDFQTNVTPQSVKLTVNDVGFEFHLLTMHSMSIACVAGAKRGGGREKGKREGSPCLK